jgi:hypothetical protein
MDRLLAFESDANEKDEMSPAGTMQPSIAATDGVKAVGGASELVAPARTSTTEEMT